MLQPLDETPVEKAVALDPHLGPYRHVLQARYNHLVHTYQTVVREEGSVEALASGHKHFGFNIADGNVITYREWAPRAQAAYLVGDFSTDSASSHS